MNIDDNTGKSVLFSIGEALIDFIPQQTGCDFAQVKGFSPAVGGAPANVCGAFAKLGGRASMLTQLGDDPFGHKIAGVLSGCGVDTSHISFTGKANTALAFVSLNEDGGRTFSFYRKPSADMLYTGEELDEAVFRDAFALHFCSVSLGDYPMRGAHRRAIDAARRAGAMISFDPNLRFALWDSREELRRTVNEFLPLADIVKLSDEELEFITGEKSLESALPKLLTGSVKLVIFTCGKDGAYASNGAETVFAPSEPVKAVDTTGAGDGFIGSFLYCLYRAGIAPDMLGRIGGEQLHEWLAFSNRFCAISVGRSGAIPSYPDADQMNLQ